MRKTFLAMLVAGTIGLLPRPTPADAAIPSFNCLSESIDECDNLFPGTTDKLVGVRGWCYLIWWGWCEWLDP